jgi:lipoyl(octanoyl) transferase
MTVVQDIVVKQLGRTSYGDVLQDMRAFTRSPHTGEEIWLTEHEPVYTLGQGAPERTVANGIPVVRSDRGGDITYHGPGQVVLYPLINLAARGIKVKRYVWLLEQAAIDLVGGERRPGAPGVYVDGAKIAALGIRVVRGRAYHGLSLNVDMDLSPFDAIDPCGYPGLKVTQMRDIGFSETKEQAGLRLSSILIEKLDA